MLPPAYHTHWNTDHDPINKHNVPTPSMVSWSSNQHTQCTHSIHKSCWSYGPPINIHNVPTPSTTVVCPMVLQSTYTMYPLNPQQLVVLWTSNQHTQCTHSTHNSWWSYGPPINIHNVPIPPTKAGGPMDLQSTYTKYQLHPQQFVVLWTSN